MPVVQSPLPSAGSPFPVTMAAATVVAPPGSTPSQAVLLPPPPTRYDTHTHTPDYTCMIPPALHSHSYTMLQYWSLLQSLPLLTISLCISFRITYVQSTPGGPSPIPLVSTATGSTSHTAPPAPGSAYVPSPLATFAAIAHPGQTLVQPLIAG